MADPVVFNTKDWGAWVRDKLNEMSQMPASSGLFCVRRRRSCPMIT